MGVPTIVVARHWRPEVVDIAQTLRDVVAGRDSSTVRVVGGGRWPRPSLAFARADVLVLSDTAPAPKGGPAVVRLWWNEATEVAAFVAAHELRPPEINICFFPDTADELRERGIETTYVPYAFAPLEPPAVGFAPFVGYTGEVDISDRCFDGLDRQLVPRLHAMATDLAGAIVGGATSMVEADGAIRADSDTDATTAPIVGWSMRNHVRYQLLRVIVATFPTAAKVRGSDWQALGFDAAKTSFGRRRRRREYRTNRVSVDLGSKSTTAALYPRSAEVMSVGGGLVQFDSGTPTPPELPTLAGRRAAHADGVVAIIDRLLHLEPEALRAENGRLQHEYSSMRLISGALLLDAFGAGAL